MEKLIAINKPFAMLLNVRSVFDSKKRMQLAIKNDLQYLVIYPRVNYITPNGKTKQNANQSVYVCKDILPRQLEYSFMENE